MGWIQPGFVVVSDVGGGLPLVHAFHLAQWEADRTLAERQKLSADLTRNIRVQPATLNFDP